MKLESVLSCIFDVPSHISSLLNISGTIFLMMDIFPHLAASVLDPWVNSSYSKQSLDSQQFSSSPSHTSCNQLEITATINLSQELLEKGQENMIRSVLGNVNSCSFLFVDRNKPQDIYTAVSTTEKWWTGSSNIYNLHTCACFIYIYHTHTKYVYYCFVRTLIRKISHNRIAFAWWKGKKRLERIQTARLNGKSFHKTT